jgi:hypothetical protein
MSTACWTVGARGVEDGEVAVAAKVGEEVGDNVYGRRNPFLKTERVNRDVL